MSGLDNIVAKSPKNKKQPLHAFFDDNNGDVSTEDEIDRIGENGSNNNNGNGNGNGSGSGNNYIGQNYRNRLPYDGSPGNALNVAPARNPFHSIVEESKSGLSSASPSSPILFPSSQSPSTLSSPIAASQRLLRSFKDDNIYNEKSKNNYDNDNNDMNRHNSYEKIEIERERERERETSGYVKRASVIGLSVSGGVLTKTKSELSALKRRTGTAGSGREGREGRVGAGIGIGGGGGGGGGYIGGDVGSGLDCDADVDYDIDDRDRERRDKGNGTYGNIDRRHDASSSSSSHNNGAIGIGIGMSRNHIDQSYNNNYHNINSSSSNNNSNNNSNRSIGSQPYKSYQSNDDEDGEEPELDIIRNPGPSAKSHRQPDSNNNSTSMTGNSNRGPSSNNSSTNSTPAPSSKSRVIQSATVSRTRPPVSTSTSSSTGVPLRRPSTTTSGKSSVPARTNMIRSSFNGGSLPTTSRVPSRDNESGDDNDNIGHAYRYNDNLSSKSSGRVPSGSGVRVTRCRSRSKEPTHKASPVIVKKDNFRQRENSREPLDDDDCDESKWICNNCGRNNMNQFYCDYCATKRINYSLTPDNIRIQRDRQPPK